MKLRLLIGLLLFFAVEARCKYYPGFEDLGTSWKP